MKIALDESKACVKAKLRKYPADQRKFLDAYFEELVSMGFLKTRPQAEWKAVPYLVAKDSKCKYRTTLGLRPLNAARNPEKWPLTHTEAEITDFIGSKHLASLGFCSLYWHCPLEASLYLVSGIKAPQRTFVSKRELHCLRSASTHYQPMVPPLFDTMKHTLQAWFDHFVLYTAEETELLHCLGEFFTICGSFDLRISATKFVFYTSKVKCCSRMIERDR